MTRLVFVSIILSSTIIGLCSSAKILAILHTPGYSHFIAGGVLTKELAIRGHEVTVVSAFPQKTKIANYKDVELTGILDWMKQEMSKMVVTEYEEQNMLTKTMLPLGFGCELTNMVLNHTNVQKLMKSGETFDVVIVEQFYSEGLFGICHHFKAPCIAFSTVGANLFNNRLVGNIGLTSYIPDMLGGYSPKMIFFERLQNLVSQTFQEVVFHLYAVPKLDKVMHEYIPDAPDLSQLMYNISLVFLNSHPALTAAVPMTPNLVEIGGIHVEGLKNEKLPEDVQEFLDKHEEGVIYFALGSNFRSKDLPPEKLQAVLGSLKKFRKPVLWKFEEELPEKIEHVKVAKWFPQTAVLAHKNVKAFITHCGRLSSLESLYYGVPMVGISLFAEQAHNAAEMVHLGYAVWIKFKTLTADNLYNALVEITTNPKYSNEAKLRSRAMRKEKITEKAIYWIEHVIEFKGATYLRTAAIDLPWYQLWMVDVVAFLLVSVLTVISIFMFLFYSLCCKSRNKNTRSKRTGNSKEKTQ